MPLKENNIISTIVFVVFFVVQFIVSNSLVAMNLHNSYWLFYFVTVIFIGIRSNIFSKEYRKERIFTYMCFAGALLTYFLDVKYGFVFLKILTIFTGYVGYVYLINHKIDLRIFPFLFILLYLFFFDAYFSHKTFLVETDDEFDLFGHASSNLIPMALNGVLIFYYYINRKQNDKHLPIILVLSLINLSFVIIQSSRAGLLVSVLLSLMVLYDCYKKSQRYKKFYVTLFILIIAASITRLSLINDYISTVFVDIYDYEADCRKIARGEFFNQMTYKSAIFGYGQNITFGGLGRTFNSFLDFWANYGLLPTIGLIYLCVKRITKRKEYSISLYMIAPLFVYSYFEDLWVLSMWNILLFMALFYSKNSLPNEYN